MAGVDRELRRLIGETIVVPLDGGSARGVLKHVAPGWIVLAECQTKDGPIDGRLMLRLPLPWVQVVP